MEFPKLIFLKNDSYSPHESTFSLGNQRTQIRSSNRPNIQLDIEMTMTATFTHLLVCLSVCLFVCLLASWFVG